MEKETNKNLDHKKLSPISQKINGILEEILEDDILDRKESILEYVEIFRYQQGHLYIGLMYPLRFLDKKESIEFLRLIENDPDINSALIRDVRRQIKSDYGEEVL